KHTGARFFSSALGNFACDDVTDSSKSKLTLFGFALNLLPIFWACAFGHHDERVQIARGIAFFDGFGNSIIIERDFRNQNDVPTPGEPAVPSDPASMASDHLDDHDPLVP